MKKVAAMGAVYALLAAGATCLVFGTAAGTRNPAEANDVTLTGTLSCTFCAMANPGMPCPPGCCTDCVKKGDPPLLTDALGNMYTLLSHEKGGTLMTSERLAMMGGQVTVKGLFVSRDGIRAIYVDSMEKPKSQNVSIAGRLSCTFCTLANPGMSCPVGCCGDCIKKGDPPLLTDARGSLYLLLSGEKGTALMTPERLAMAGGQVAVKGMLVTRNGIRVIYVDSMQKVTPGS